MSKFNLHYFTKNTGFSTCKKNAFSLNLVALALLSIASPANAQSTEEAANTSKSKLEVIEVTAQKRAESLQEIPIAVSALNEEALQQSGFDGVEDLSFLVPSLQLGNFGPTTFLSIRGIGSENTTGGSDPGVALHVDGVYVGRPVGALFSAFDAERVEVLRGPQGTLYGRNATGGSVNLLSKKPEEEFSGKVDATIGNYNRKRLRGAINIPLSDTVNTRFVGFIEDRDGFNENSVAGGTEANDADNYGFRGHVNIDFTDTFSVLLSGTVVNNQGVGSQAEQRDPFAVGPLAGPGPESLRLIQDENGNPYINDLEPFKEGKDAAESQDNEFTLFSATFDWEFDSFLIKAITGFVESEYVSVQDNDQTPAAIQILTIEETAEQISQEIQFISNTDSDFRWITGLYYFNEDVERFSMLGGPRFDAVTGFLNANVPGFTETTSFRIGGGIETTSYAVFAQGTYDFTDNLSLTAGIRYTDDEKEGFNRNIIFAPLVVDAVRVEAQETTGKLALDWQLESDILLYTSFARGYKSGGVNQTTIASSGSNPIFNPEFVDTIELGLKTQLWETVRLNVALYNSDYTDLQFQVFGEFGPEAGNAGEATIQGLEVEWTWLLGDVWSFDGSFAATDAEYDVLITGPGEANDFSGNVLPRTPDLTYNLGLNGEWELNDGSYILARFDVSYTDEIYYEFTNRSQSLADDYYNLNFRTFWSSADEQYSVEFYVTNLTDEVQEGNILVGFSLGDEAGAPGQEYITYNAPRQIGLTVGYQF